MTTEQNHPDTADEGNNAADNPGTENQAAADAGNVEDAGAPAGADVAQTPTESDTLPAPDPAVLRSTIGGRWAHVRDDVRAQADASMLTPLGLSMDEHREHVNANMRRLAEIGLPQHGFAPQDGGSGDTGAALTSFEMLGHFDLSLMVKAGVQWGLFGGAVSNLGDADIRKKILPGAISLDIPGCFAMTELGQGSDVQNLETTATYDPDSREFVIHTPTESATKAYIGGAGRDARLAAVFAQLITGGPGQEPESAGVHCLVVPIRDDSGDALPGVTLTDHGPKGGLQGVDNGRITFDHVRVPRENLLNRFGQVAEDGTYSSPIESQGRRFFTMLGTLIRGRVSVGAASGAAARTSLAVALRYANARTQFTAPDEQPIKLITYREHQRRLLPLVAKAYAYAAAQNAIISDLHEFEENPDSLDDRERRQLEAHAAGIKATVSAWANDTITEARLACGGAGYMAENRLTSARADCDVFSTFEGDNVVLTQQLAKELLTAYSTEFGDMSTVETVQFAAGFVTDRVREWTRASKVWQKVVDSVTDRENTDLLDRSVQHDLLADREEHLVETVARRLRSAGEADDADESFRVFNDAQDHMLASGRAHMDLYTYEKFAEAIDDCEDPHTKRILVALCDLFFLSIVDDDKGWLLEHNRLTTERTKRATAQYNRLCGMLAEHSGALAEGLGVPEVALDVPLLADAGAD